MVNSTYLRLPEYAPETDGEQVPWGTVEKQIGFTKLKRFTLLQCVATTVDNPNQRFLRSRPARRCQERVLHVRISRIVRFRRRF